MSLIGDMKALHDDSVWKALADPTRRQILDALADTPVTTGEIVDQFAPQLVRTAVMKHLDVLESAGLVRVERVGRRRLNHFERAPLKEIAGWLNRRVANHKSNLTGLKQLAEKQSA